MPINFYYDQAASLYVLFDDASDTAVNLTEGTSLKAGRYTVADAAIQSAGLAQGTYNYRILVGLAASKSASDSLAGVNAEPFRWSGSAELYAAADTLAIAGAATVTPGANGGLPTVDANNRIAGLQGTINSLDTLWTQTNNGFSTISTIVSGTSSKIGNFVAAGGNTLLEYILAIMSASATKPSAAPVDYDPAVHSLEANADAVGAVGGSLTPGINRANYDAAWQLYAVSRRDGTYGCDRPMRPSAGAINTTVSVDMSKLWGKHVKVTNVTDVEISGGSITTPDEFIRETTGIVQLGGTATAGEERTVTMRIHGDNNISEWVTFEIEVGE